MFHRRSWSLLPAPQQQRQLPQLRLQPRLSRQPQACIAAVFAALLLHQTPRWHTGVFAKRCFASGDARPGSIATSTRTRCQLKSETQQGFVNCRLQVAAASRRRRSWTRRLPQPRAAETHNPPATPGARKLWEVHVSVLTTACSHRRSGQQLCGGRLHVPALVLNPNHLPSPTPGVCCDTLQRMLAWWFRV